MPPRLPPSSARQSNRLRPDRRGGRHRPRGFQAIPGMPEHPHPRTMRRSALTVMSRPDASPARRRPGADVEPSHGMWHYRLAAILAHSLAVSHWLRYTVPKAMACAFCQTSLMVGRSPLCSYFEVIISILTRKVQNFVVVLVTYPTLYAIIPVKY